MSETFAVWKVRCDAVFKGRSEEVAALAISESVQDKPTEAELMRQFHFPVGLVIHHHRYLGQIEIIGRVPRWQARAAIEDILSNPLWGRPRPWPDRPLVWLERRIRKLYPELVRRDPDKPPPRVQAKSRVQSRYFKDQLDRLNAGLPVSPVLRHLSRQYIQAMAETPLEGLPERVA